MGWNKDRVRKGSRVTCECTTYRNPPSPHLRYQAEQSFWTAFFNQMVPHSLLFPWVRAPKSDEPTALSVVLCATADALATCSLLVPVHILRALRRMLNTPVSHSRRDPGMGVPLSCSLSLSQQLLRGWGGADCSALLRFPAGGHLWQGFEVGNARQPRVGKKAQTKSLDVEEQWSAVSIVPSKRAKSCFMSALIHKIDLWNVAEKFKEISSI